MSMGPLDRENILQCVVSGMGKILCTVKVTKAIWAPNVDFVEREEWNKRAMCEVAGKFLLFLDEIKPLKGRLPVCGRQGIFNVPDELLEEVPKN